MSIDASPDETEAIVLVKAAPNIGRMHGETVCCAAVDFEGNWLRLYPISFFNLDEDQRFGRWDRICFKCSLPHNDSRIESRRVVQSSLKIVGQLKKSKRENFLENVIVTGLKKEREQGKSLALLRAKNIKFDYEKKNADKIREDEYKFREYRAQMSFFNQSQIPYEPCPYRFIYHYESDDGKRVGTCQDWETEITYQRREREHGEVKALDEMCKIFGEEYPKKGMLFAMGTHSQYPDTWLINGIVRLDEIKQLRLL